MLGQTSLNETSESIAAFEQREELFEQNDRRIEILNDNLKRKDFEMAEICLYAYSATRDRPHRCHESI